MSAWSARQLAALGAVVATVLLLVGFLLSGNPPKFDADPLKIVNYFHSHHSRLLASAVIVEAGVVVLIGVLGHLSIVLRGGAQRTLAAIVGIAGAAAAAALGIGYGLYGGLAQLSNFTDERLIVAPLYRWVQFIQVALFWTFLGVVVATAVGGLRGVFPRWTAALNGVVAVLLVLGGISVKGQGALQAGTGALCLVGSIAFLVFILELAYLFWTATPYVAAAAEPAPAAP
jgi:hypothetical protein